MVAFANVIEPTSENPRGAMGSLRLLSLESNQVGDAGMVALCDAISKGGLTKIKNVDVSENPGNADPLKAACKSRGIKCNA